MVENEQQDYQKRIEDLEAQLAAEKAKATRAVYLKVSEKGGASLYGIRRFPITFYVEEWNRILDMEPEIRSFLQKNDAELTRKG
jgi:hypothetical protein